jgi:hypothetical protein
MASSKENAIKLLQCSSSQPKLTDSLSDTEENVSSSIYLYGKVEQGDYDPKSVIALHGLNPSDVLPFVTSSLESAYDMINKPNDPRGVDLRLNREQIERVAEMSLEQAQSRNSVGSRPSSERQK